MEGIGDRRNMGEDRSRQVFIDESGDSSLEIAKEGVSDLYVLTAIIVPSPEISVVEESARRVIEKHFGKGEMKSSNVGRKLARRKSILVDMAKVPFKHYSWVIHKADIWPESGLRYKKTFRKFFQNTICRRLLEAFPEIHVVADEHGTTEFMKEFAKYLESRFPPKLFETSSFEFRDSADFPLIQFGDMIAGTIARSYRGEDPRDILDSLKENTIIINE
jgi:hypothetical protein